MSRGGTELDSWIWIIIIIAVVAVALFLLRLTMIGMRMKESMLGRTIALLREIRHNEKTGRHYGYKGGLQLFRTGVWEIHKHNLEFLPEEIRGGLNALYEKVYLINDQLQASVDGKGENYLMSVNVDSLMLPLKENAVALDSWIKANHSNPQYAPKPVNIFGF